MKTDLDQVAYHIKKDDPRLSVLVASSAIDRKTVTLGVQVVIRRTDRQRLEENDRTFLGNMLD